MFKCHKFSGALIGRRMLHICFNGFSNLKQPSTVFFKSLPLKVNKTTPGIPGYDAIIILTPWIYKPLDKNEPYQHPSTHHPKKISMGTSTAKAKDAKASKWLLPQRQWYQWGSTSPRTEFHKEVASCGWQSICALCSSVRSGSVWFDMDHAIPIFFWSDMKPACSAMWIFMLI